MSVKRPGTASRLLATVAAAASTVAWMSMAAACSSSSSSTSQASGSSSTSQATGGTGITGTAGITGMKLKSALLPASEFPAGYKLYPKASYDSGSQVSNPPARSDLATMSCGTFAVQLGTHGFGETAMATNEFLDSARRVAFIQSVYQFPQAGTASTFFAGLRAATLRCHSFTAPAFNVSTQWTQQVSAAAPVSGRSAIRIVQTASAPGLTSNLDDLFVLDGANVYGTMRVAVGTTPSAQPAPTAVIAKLITRVRALH